MLDFACGILRRRVQKCYPRRKAQDHLENGSAWMNKSEIAGWVADRIGMSQSAARDAVDTVFEAVSEALANGEGSAGRLIRHLRH